MFTWIAENWATILICAGLAAIVIAVIVSMIRSKKKGGSSCGCGCGCGSCPMGSSCHDEAKKED